MSHALRLLVAFAVVCVTPACTTRIDARLDTITRENVPAADVSSPAFLGIRNSIAHEAGEYIVVRFTTSTDIAEKARDLDIGLVGFNLYPCGSDTYVHIGDVYPSGMSSVGYRYEVRLPTTWAKLGWRRSDGLMTSGWPLDAAATGLCMKVEGANKMSMGAVSTNEMRVDEVSKLMR